jgi:hypothetical protein
MNDIVEGGGRHTRPRVDDTSFFRGYAAQTVADFAKDLCYWAIQPHPQPLPEGWADSYRRRLEELRGLVQRNFAGVGAVIRDLQQFEDDARELIVILDSDPQISMQPVQNWPIRAYREAFERVMEWQQQFRQLAVKLNAQYEQTREELDQWRAANRQAAFSSDTGRNGRDELHDRNGVTGGGTSAPQTAPEWSKFRAPQEWRRLLGEAGISNSETTWRNHRKKYASQINGDTQNVRITRELANQWGLKLPEFTEGTRN